MAECDRCGKKITVGCLCPTCDTYLQGKMAGINEGARLGRVAALTDVKKIIDGMQDTAEAMMMWREVDACERFRAQIDKLEERYGTNESSGTS